MCLTFINFTSTISVAHREVWSAFFFFFSPVSIKESTDWRMELKYKFGFGYPGEFLKLTNVILSSLLPGFSFLFLKLTSLICFFFSLTDTYHF